MNELNIKIAGIGGSGANIIYRLIKNGTRASEFMVIDTDKNLLSKLPDIIKTLQIGEEITQGNGTNGNYDKGLLSAYSNTKEITSFLKGSQDHSINCRFRRRNCERQLANYKFCFKRIKYFYHWSSYKTIPLGRTEKIGYCKPFN